MLAVGLQRKSFEQLSVELNNHATTQLMALFNQAIRKMVERFNAICENALEKGLADENAKADALLVPKHPVAMSLDVRL